jgi:hypothetical protein
MRLAPIQQANERDVRVYVRIAERKLGEMLKAAKEAGQIKEGGTGSNQYRATIPDENSSKTTLSEVGISRKLSSRAQKIAAIPADEFD